VTERGDTHFEERREMDMKSHASQERLSLRKRVFCRGSWHIPRRGVGTHSKEEQFSYFLLSLYRYYSEAIRQLRLTIH
jgi:hypothetical protein